MRNLTLLFVFLFSFTACREAVDEDTTPDQKDHAESSPTDDVHGAIVALGSVELGGERFAIARHGACQSGKEGAFAVTLVGEGQHTGLFLWVEDAEGNQVSAPAQGERAGESWHFHATPRAAAAEPTTVVLRLREGDVDERAGLPLHADVAPVHDGVPAPVLRSNGEVAGWLELKLHDDEGDLEIWLSKDEAMTEPMDLALDAVVEVRFHDHADRRVELRIRDSSTNEDEDGHANIRNASTNYFTFPGEREADTSWLSDHEFKSIVTVAIPTPAGLLYSSPFLLVPHAGGDDHDH